MSHVVLLKGVNVGGHRTFRPSLLARTLAHLDIVNIGAAGTFVVRKRIARAALVDAFVRALPFETDVVVVEGSALLQLVASNPLAAAPAGPDVVPFVSTLARRASPSSPLPLDLPMTGEWGLRILSQHHRFVCGVYRRQMKAVSYLGQLEKIFGVPATTRNWNTMQAIARVLSPSIHA